MKLDNKKLMWGVICLPIAIGVIIGVLFFVGKLGFSGEDVGRFMASTLTPAVIGIALGSYCVKRFIKKRKLKNELNKTV